MFLVVKYTSFSEVSWVKSGVKDYPTQQEFLDVDYPKNRSISASENGYFEKKGTFGRGSQTLKPLSIGQGNKSVGAKRAYIGKGLCTNPPIKRGVINAPRLVLIPLRKFGLLVSLLKGVAVALTES
jgi:hypothetical protein